MSIVAVGECDRCKIKVNQRPGLGYADRRGYFMYCKDCLSETGLGYGEAMRGMWLEDVLKNPALEDKTAGYYLGEAEHDWHKIKDIDCGCKKCSPHRLKRNGCPSPKRRKS